MVTPKKRLGQHFLRDENIARKITGFLNLDYPLVLEIGPGTGVLSKYLLDHQVLDPYFMEVDHESVVYLNETYPQISDRLIEADFLTSDLSGFPPSVIPACPSGRSHASSAISPPFTIIGNFPYNISTQILFRVLENRDRIPEVIGMFQKEVAERIASPPGNKTYGILSVLLQAFYDIDYLFTVNETVFYPPPRVKSAVIRLRRNKTLKLDCNEEVYFRVVKTAFNQRRKTLRNSLRSLTGSINAAGVESLSDLFSLRPEQLGVDDFIRLTKAIYPEA